MHTRSESLTPSVCLDLPAAQHATSNASNPDPPVIRDDIIDSLGEGDHHPDSVPTENTPLPPIDTLRDVVAELHDYLHNAGAAIVADAHLQGQAAPVHTTADGTVYAYLDRSLFTTVCERVIDADGPSRDSTETEELVEAVVSAHTLEFSAALRDQDVNAGENASWPAMTGQRTDAPVGIVFTLPHPVTALDEYPNLPERGLALAAGIQRLATDINDVYSQRDIALAYLPAYLRAHGLSAQEANTLVASWYDEPGECISHVGQEITTHIATHGFPARDPELTYYLTDAAYREIAGT